VAQAVECPPSKYEALSSNPITANSLYAFKHEDGEVRKFQKKEGSITAGVTVTFAFAP
jgi:hypothetical protein